MTLQGGAAYQRGFDAGIGSSLADPCEVGFDDLSWRHGLPPSTLNHGAMPVHR